MLVIFETPNIDQDTKALDIFPFSEGYIVLGYLELLGVSLGLQIQ
jgi:hypothetical protein